MSWLWIALSLAFVIGYGIQVTRIALNGHPLGYWDELAHLNTQLIVHDGMLPTRGDLYLPAVKLEWACGVGHDLGAITLPCGNPDLITDDLPVGRYSSGYIHYPTYFLGAEAFRSLTEMVGLNLPVPGVYRLFSALSVTAALLTTGAFAFGLGVRGPGLLAAVTLPAVGTANTTIATMINPNSMSLLVGALVAGTLLLWAKRGKGFIWVALASVLASITSVVASLAIGATVLFLVLFLIFARNVHLWRPRWWQIVCLILIAISPPLLWARYIESSATVGNAELYTQSPIPNAKTLISRMVLEVWNLHGPWESIGTMSASKSLKGVYLQVANTSAPMWVAITVLGGVCLIAINVVERRRRRLELVPFGTLRLLAISTISTFLLYAPLLWLTKIVNSGLDDGIPGRYSAALIPFFVIIAILGIRNKRYHRLLAIVGAFAIAVSIAT